MLKESKTLYIIIPCYNEQECLPKTVPAFLEKIHFLKNKGLISSESKLLFVNDGSKDNTWDLLEEYSKTHPPDIIAISFKNNRGHQLAIMTGMQYAVSVCNADFVVTIDADLQDDIDCIDKMVELSENYDIICGVRSNRDSDSFIKRFTAESFYKILNLVSGEKIIYNHADFRLMSKKAVNKLMLYHTDDLFIRGLVTKLRLPLTTVEYIRSPRAEGKTKYTLKKMLKLSADGFKLKKNKPYSSPRNELKYIKKF